MKFKYTILYVNSVKNTLAFYNKAFALNIKMFHESGEYGELDTGSTVLAFSSYESLITIGKTPKKADVNSPAFEIAFETEDVKTAVLKAIKEGATLVQEAQEMPWGQTVAYVSDENGFLIEICSPVTAHA